MAQTDGKEQMVSVVSLGDYNLTFTATIAVGSSNRQVSVSVPSV